MKLNLYSVFDRASGAYMRPFPMQSDGQAMRVFGDLCVDASHEFSKHPGDYTLMRIGIFDDNKGELIPEIAEKLVNGLEVISEAQSIEPGSLKEVV